MKFKNYHGQWEDLDTTDMFCPNCGEKTIYVEKGEGDYYQGPTHYCYSCKNEFHILGGQSPNDKLEFKVDE